MKTDLDWLNWTFGPDFRNSFALYLGPLVIYRARKRRNKTEGFGGG